MPQTRELAAQLKPPLQGTLSERVQWLQFAAMVMGINFSILIDQIWESSQKVQERFSGDRRGKESLLHLGQGVSRLYSQVRTEARLPTLVLQIAHGFLKQHIEKHGFLVCAHQGCQQPVQAWKFVRKNNGATKLYCSADCFCAANGVEKLVYSRMQQMGPMLRRPMCGSSSRVKKASGIKTADGLTGEEIDARLGEIFGTQRPTTTPIEPVAAGGDGKKGIQEMLRSAQDKQLQSATAKFEDLLVAQLKKFLGQLSDATSGFLSLIQQHKDALGSLQVGPAFQRALTEAVQREIKEQGGIKKILEPNLTPHNEGLVQIAERLGAMENILGQPLDFGKLGTDIMSSVGRKILASQEAIIDASKPVDLAPLMKQVGVLCERMAALEDLLQSGEPKNEGEATPQDCGNGSVKPDPILSEKNDWKKGKKFTPPRSYKFLTREGKREVEDNPQYWK